MSFEFATPFPTTYIKPSAADIPPGCSVLSNKGIMNNIRITISGALLAMGLGFGVGASAQTTGLSAAPNPLNIGAPGGSLSTAYVTITNHGPGFASNLAVVMPAPFGPGHGSITSIADTCTGATLAQGGTCTVRVQYEAPCYIRAGYQDTYYVQVTSSQFPVLNEKVVGTNTSNACE